MAAALAACGTDDVAPHELVECGSGQCERACNPPPATDPNSSCLVLTPTEAACQGVFEIDGVRGCCIFALEPEPPAFRFLECE